MFKPQATLLPLLFFLGWSALKRERRLFWVGLALTGIVLWGIGEVLEPGWVFSFLGALSSYVPLHSVVDLVWNPYQIVSLALLLLTVWFLLHLRCRPAASFEFSGLLAWTVSLNALIIPMFGMLHIVLIGPVLVIVLNGVAALYPRFVAWLWGGVIGLFVMGMLAFTISLLISGTGGLHIASAEAVYRFSMPALLCLASLPLILNGSWPMRVRSAGLDPA